MTVRPPISPTLHGLIDYAYAAALPGLARAAGATPRLRALAEVSALFVLAYSALTDYPLGLIRLLPMRAHLAADVVTSSALVAIPLLEREPGGGKTAVAGFGGLGFLVILATRRR